MAGKVVSKNQGSAESTTIAAGDRSDGKVTVMVPVSQEELDWLIAKKYLAEKERENVAAIKQAIESFLSASAKAAVIVVTNPPDMRR